MAKPLKFDFRLAPEKSIKILKAKKPQMSFDFYEMEHEAHQKAFTVAKMMRLDLLSDVQHSLISSMRDGKSFTKWKKEITPTLQKAGWYGRFDAVNPATGEVKETVVGSRRLRTIFDTNMRTAHAQGRAQGIYSSKSEYLRYSATLDSKTRKSHRAIHAIVKHRSDPFWQINFPPNGYHCRCYIKSYTKKALERRGLEVTKKEYANVADKSFAYDTRGLSKERLEKLYYEKALKRAENCIERNSRLNVCLSAKKSVLEAIAFISDVNRDRKFKKFVGDVLKDKTTPHNLAVAGSLSVEVFEYLKSKEMVPESPLVVMTKHSLLHAQRGVKKKRGAALSIEDIKNIPNMLKSPHMTLYDTAHKNVLYVLNTDDESLKIVVGVNYKIKKEALLGNVIITSDIEKTQSIEGFIKGGLYEIIK